ncbi:MAG TPA: hypothetical protein VGE93_16170, partial [Bryobacteraceae bacterium]
QRHHLHVRLVPFAIVWLAHQEPIAHMLPVRQIAVDSRDDGDAFRPVSLGAQGRSKGSGS